MKLALSKTVPALGEFASDQARQFKFHVVNRHAEVNLNVNALDRLADAPWGPAPEGVVHVVEWDDLGAPVTPARVEPAPPLATSVTVSEGRHLELSVPQGNYMTDGNCMISCDLAEMLPCVDGGRESDGASGAALAAQV